MLAELFVECACFAALLGTADHGYWKIAADGQGEGDARRYLPDSMIVETTFETSTGTVVLVDFMPPRGEYSDVVRIVRCTKGKVCAEDATGDSLRLWPDDSLGDAV